MALTYHLVLDIRQKQFNHDDMNSKKEEDRLHVVAAQ